MDENKENLIKVLKENIIEDLNNIISCNVAIWRKNKDGNYVTIPIDKIKQYVGESDDTFEFFIEKDWKNKIKDQQEQNNAEENSKQDEEVKKAISYVKRYGEVEDQLKNFQLMSVVEREEILDNSIENLY